MAVPRDQRQRYEAGTDPVLFAVMDTHDGRKMMMRNTTANRLNQHYNALRDAEEIHLKLLREQLRLTRGLEEVRDNLDPGISEDSAVIELIDNLIGRELTSEDVKQRVLGKEHDRCVARQRGLEGGV